MFWTIRSHQLLNSFGWIDQYFDIHRSIEIHRQYANNNSKRECSLQIISATFKTSCAKFGANTTMNPIKLIKTKTPERTSATVISRSRLELIDLVWQKTSIYWGLIFTGHAVSNKCASLWEIACLHPQLCCYSPQNIEQRSACQW